ncbi:hypothetical protein Zmor_026155 [Zophobas morio]|uniref:Annexin n=1 Tax=Zophobas morio TaxID=2755281 RepID=A0AA38HTL8_9CUCU|nr:hypothetical protein Zmor_026155 [Zophobas morio]
MSHQSLPILQKNGPSPAPSPTVHPQEFFLANEDAAILKKAMRGFGTNEKSIINVLTKRSLAQRLEIINQYNNLYKTNLLKEFKSELSGNFRKLIQALMTPLPQFYAKELHYATKGLGTNEHILIEILCTVKHSQIAAIQHAYHHKYKKTLDSDVRADTSGDFKSLLVSLINAKRDESTTTNLEQAKADAMSLYKAGEKRWGTDESTFNRILCFQSFAQLQLVFEHYDIISGHSIEKAIENEFSGSAKDCLLSIIQCVRNTPAFLAKQLHKSVKGLGTNDRDLRRLIVTRCEIDMGDIKKEYQAKYSESLADAIKGDSSGDYKKCMLTLIGE